MQQTRMARENLTGLAMFTRALDAVLVFGAQFAALRFCGVRWDAGQGVGLAMALLVFGAVAEYHRLYHTAPGERLIHQLGKLVAVWPTVVSILLLIAFATKTSQHFSRLAAVSWFVATPICMALLRLCLRVILRQFYARVGRPRTVAIVGCTPLAQRLIDIMQQDATLSLDLAGVYDDRVERRQVRSDIAAMVTGNLQQLITSIREGTIKRVYLTLPLRAEDRVSDILHRLADTTATVYYVPDLSSFTLLRARVTSVGHIPAFSIFDSPFQGMDGSLKRAEDLFLGTIALIIAGIPMILVAIAIKLTTRGPVFFRQRRYGLGGKEIRIFKFRTMTVAEDGTTVARATQDDGRVTTIGAVLRRTSIDELPQLLNVLSGSMSLVGPRPHAIVHNEQYRSIVGNYMLRHKVKPGITGWAQVNGLRGETDVTEKMRKRVEYDLFYINNWNLFFDIQIMWLTVFGRHVRKNAF